MPAKTPPPEPAPAPTFESALERLEHIVEQMENQELPLEQLIERYEEGAGLVKTCQEKLETAERRIEIITRKHAGKPQVTDFEPAAATPAGPAKAAPAAAEESDEISLF